jgi:SAM-dependent methyltransferase
MAEYDADLAYIHDVGYGDFARRSGPAILKLLRSAKIRSGLVVDLGCGSGIWARQLVDAGYDVLGIDASRAMLALARRRVPEGKFRHGSALTCGIPPCRAVTAMGEVFNYATCPSEGETPAEPRRGQSRRAISPARREPRPPNTPLRALEQILRRIYDALEPGGLLVFDIAEPGRSRGMQQSHRSGRDWACLVDYEHDDANARLTRRIQTFRRVGKSYRRAAQTHRLQLFPGRDVMGLLRQIGFRAGRQRSYGGFPFPAAVQGIVARK